MDEGRYEVIIVRYGTRLTRRSDAFLNYHFYGLPDGDITVDYFFWIVRNRDRTIVVDTGFSPDGGRKRGRTMLLHPLAAMRALGIDPASGPDVIVTHAHYDHIGNISELSSSRLLISRREYEFWTSEMACRRQFAHFSERSEIDELVTAESAGRLCFVGDGHRPAPGITVMELGGHTPGQLALSVATPDGPVLLASDAVHFYEELEADMPFISVTDLPATYAGLDTIRHMLGRTPHHLVTGHDSSTLHRFPALRGSLAEHAAVIGAGDSMAIPAAQELG